jgi:hypothetical protein
VVFNQNTIFNKGGKMKKIYMFLVIVFTIIFISGCTQELPPEPGSPGAIGKAVEENWWTSPVNFFVGSDPLFFEVGTNEADQKVIVEADYIYYKGYYLSRKNNHETGEWVAFEFSGDKVQNWIKNSAIGYVSLTKEDILTDRHAGYILAYSCNRISGGWDCHNSKWMMYEFDTVFKYCEDQDLRCVVGEDIETEITKHSVEECINYKWTFSHYCNENEICKEGICVEDLPPEPPIIEDIENETCTDSDGGKNYYKKGTVSYCERSDTTGTCQGATDSCDLCTSACAPGETDCKLTCSTVREYFCTIEGIESVTYTCPSRCEDGACILNVTCGYSKAYDLEKDTIIFGNIVTWWSINSKERGWIYYTDEQITDDRIYMGIAKTNNVNEVDCSKVELYDRDPEGNSNAISIRNNQILCMKQGGFYGLLIPIIQTYYEEEPDYIEYKWYFNGDGSSVFKECKDLYCGDSDGGQNVNESGFVTYSGQPGQTPGVFATNTDYCSNEKELIEHFCRDSLYESDKFICPGRCSNGACIKSEPSCHPDGIYYQFPDLILTEYIYEKKDSLSGNDFALLSGGLYNEYEGDFDNELEYEESLSFENGRFVYDQDDYSNLTDFYLYFQKSNNVYSYVLDFYGNGVKYNIDEVKEDLVGSRINLQGQEFTIFDADNDSTGRLDKLSLLKGDSIKWLEKNQPFIIGDFEIKVEDLGENNITKEYYCIVSVNDESKILTKGEITAFGDLNIGLLDVIFVHSQYENQDSCELSIGTEEITIRHNDEVEINGANVDGSLARFESYAETNNGLWDGFRIEYNPENDLYLSERSSWIDPVFSEWKLDFLNILEEKEPVQAELFISESNSKIVCESIEEPIEEPVSEEI